MTSSGQQSESRGLVVIRIAGEYELRGSGGEEGMSGDGVFCQKRFLKIELMRL